MQHLVAHVFIGALRHATDDLCKHVPIGNAILWMGGGPHDDATSRIIVKISLVVLALVAVFGFGTGIFKLVTETGPRDGEILRK